MAETILVDNRLDHLNQCRVATHTKIGIRCIDNPNLAYLFNGEVH